jgi:hypothetical protein
MPPINLTTFRSASRQDRPKHRHLSTLLRTMEPIFNSSSANSIAAAARKRDAVIIIVAALMLVFGIAELAAGFRHAFFSLRPIHITVATYLGAGMGVLYLFAGSLILTAKKSAAALALCLLAIIILGHVAMVVADWYPTDTVTQLFVIVLGTSIASAFFVVLALKWETFV